jgi:hypothetical protein
MKKILGLLLILVCAIQLSAQKNKKKISESVPLVSIDTLLQSIPMTRQLFHIKIDDALENIDKLDGIANGKVEKFRDEETSNLINANILRRGKQLANYIENETFETENGPNNQTKIKYLRKVEDNLKLFYNDIYDGEADLVSYSKIMTTLQGIIIATKENNLAEYVKSNATMSMYYNRSLLESKPVILNSFIDSMCYKYPEAMEGRMKELAEFEGSGAIMAYIAKRNYLDLYKYAMTNGVERQIVLKSKDPLVIKLRELIYGTKIPLKALAFFKDYESGKKSLAEIDEMTSNPDAYYKSLVVKQIELGANTNYILKRDLTEEALRYVREINGLHDSSATVRFRSIQNLNAQELYYLSVLCNTEIYTSSFVKGTYALLLQKMKPQGGDEFLHSVGMDKFRTFIRMCANYNTLDTFLTTMKVDKRNEIMSSFVTGLGDQKDIDLEGSVDVADCFGSVNDPELLAFLQTEVKKEYEKNYLKNNKDGLIVYFILHTLFTSRQENADDSLFNATLTNTLSMQPINKMPFINLFDKEKGKVFEQVVFYGDKDGKDSYSNFLNFINKSGLYTIDATNPYYIKINSKTAKVPIEIYANKPLDEEGDKDVEAQSKLNTYLTNNNIAPSIMIHRGHSYHLQGTIDMMNDNNKVIILGSCGSYHNLSDILTRSEDAQMVSSKQTGTMHVTDPIIKLVNNSVMNGEDVNWVNIWSVLDKGFTNAASRDLFNDYVPPHKNLGALFLKAYKNLKAKEL